MNGTDQVSGRPSPAEIRSQTEKILVSRQLSTSPRLGRFLTFIIDKWLAGTERVKETEIAVAVFEKGEHFDPQSDSTVRTAAGRLRARLRAYYESDGVGDDIVIALNPGSYAPYFAVGGVPSPAV